MALTVKLHARLESTAYSRGPEQAVNFNVPDTNHEADNLESKLLRRLVYNRAKQASTRPDRLVDSVLAFVFVSHSLLFTLSEDLG